MGSCKACLAGSCETAFLLGIMQGNIDFSRIMEKKMETAVVYWGYRGLYRDNGKNNENCYSILGL